ncbi:MAG TPA: hypothetical protein VF452_19605, partial [Candidatus Binatia bacterium]
QPCLPRYQRRVGNFRDFTAEAPGSASRWHWPSGREDEFNALAFDDNYASPSRVRACAVD